MDSNYCLLQLGEIFHNLYLAQASPVLHTEIPCVVLFTYMCIFLTTLCQYQGKHISSST